MLWLSNIAEGILLIITYFAIQEVCGQPLHRVLSEGGVPGDHHHSVGISFDSGWKQHFNPIFKGDLIATQYSRICAPVILMLKNSDENTLKSEAFTDPTNR